MSEDGFKVSSQRLRILSVLVLISALLIGGRLYQKQIIEYPQYRAMAQKQQMSKSSIPARRGRIFATEEYGENYPLATNMTKFQLWVIPLAVRDANLTAKMLSREIGMAEGEIYKKINNKKMYIPPLEKHLEKASAERISKLDLPGVLLVPAEERYYAEGATAGQIIGFVDAEGVGRYGIEGEMNGSLVGKKGQAIAETDSLGRRISSITEKVQKKDGDDIVLTIEHSVQYKAEELLKSALKEYDAASGSILVLDVETGGVVAMANSPSFDPNKYNKVPANKQEVFNNSAVSDSWEPGSIMKPLVMAAALDRGKVTPKTTKFFKSHVTVQNYNIWTALKKSYGREDMAQVLQNSDNVAMVWIAQKLGSEWLFRYLKELGFGEKTGIELPAEVNGLMPELINWREINRATISFGQGITVTPLQLVTAYAAIANDGILFQPHIISKVIKYNGREIDTVKKDVRRVFKHKTVKDITDMMVSVVELGHGKAAGVKGYQVAGKTGTAQVPKPGGGYYEDRNIGSFAGFFPANKPKFAMLVKIDYPKKTLWAEASAGPTFGKMASWLLRYYRIPPTINSKSGL